MGEGPMAGPFGSIDRRPGSIDLVTQTPMKLTKQVPSSFEHTNNNDNDRPPRLGQGHAGAHHQGGVLSLPPLHR